MNIHSQHQICINNWCWSTPTTEKIKNRTCIQPSRKNNEQLGNISIAVVFHYNIFFHTLWNKFEYSHFFYSDRLVACAVVARPPNVCCNFTPVGGHYANVALAGGEKNSMRLALRRKKKNKLQHNIALVCISYLYLSHTHTHMHDSLSFHFYSSLLWAYDHLNEYYYQHHHQSLVKMPSSNRNIFTNRG